MNGIIKLKIKTATQQVFMIERAPECEPVTRGDILGFLMKSRPDSEWNVREVIPVSMDEIMGGAS